MTWGGKNNQLRERFDAAFYAQPALNADGWIAAGSRRGSGGRWAVTPSPPVTEEAWAFRRFFRWLQRTIQLEYGLSVSLPVSLPRNLDGGAPCCYDLTAVFLTGVRSPQRPQQKNLGLEQIQSQMAQKPVLWGEVGARAWRVCVQMREGFERARVVQVARAVLTAAEVAEAGTSRMQPQLCATTNAPPHTQKRVRSNGVLHPTAPPQVPALRLPATQTSSAPRLHTVAP